MQYPRARKARVPAGPSALSGRTRADSRAIALGPGKTAHSSPRRPTYQLRKLPSLQQGTAQLVAELVDRLTTAMNDASGEWGRTLRVGPAARFRSGREARLKLPVGRSGAGFRTLPDPIERAGRCQQL